MEGFILLGLLLLFLCLRVPIGFASGLVAVCYMLFTGMPPLPLAAQEAFGGIDAFAVLAVPFFVFAGQVMAHGGIAKNLLTLADTLLGGLPGGYALTTILGCIFLADLSGSSAATVSAIGTIMIPGMREQGYSRGFAAAVAACAGCLAVIIPPSTPMILYGVATGASIGKLFFAGFIPGLIVAASLMIPAYFISKKNGWKGKHKRSSWKEVRAAAWTAKWALFIPVIILGGIYSGTFTPTEAGAVACLYSILVGRYAYKEFTWKEFPGIIRAGICTIVPIMIIISLATVFGQVITLLGIPTHIAESLRQATTNPIMLLLLINLFLLVVGMFMETCAAIIILAPILLPLAISLGIDPIHFGIIMIINLSIGFITPPLGVNLFVASSISNVQSVKIFIAAIPFVLCMLVALTIVVLVPQTCMLLPRLLF